MHTQKDLTKMKIFQNVSGEILFETPSMSLLTHVRSVFSGLQSQDSSRPAAELAMTDEAVR